MGLDNPRVSKTGTTSSGLIWLYENSPERTNLDPAIVGLIPGNSITAVPLTSANLRNDDLTEDDLDDAENSSAEDDAENSSESSSRRSLIPSIGDIQILSNIVEYDAAGIPTGTVVFRIKNSSGEMLKGMNARIQVI